MTIHWIHVSVALGLCACTPDAPTPSAKRPACTARTVDAMIGCVDDDLYAKDVAFIAQPRPPGSSHWQAVQDRCAERFGELGFSVTRQAYGSGVNVVGTKSGGDLGSESVLVGAHYDSTDDTCPAADDNATGVAGVLETARVLAGGNFRRSLMVVCWDEEETGLIGSRAHASSEQGSTVRLAFAYETIGYFDDTPGSQTLPDGLDLAYPDVVAEVASNEHRGDFLAIVANALAGDSARALAAHAGDLGLNEILIEVSPTQQMDPNVDDLRRSDHASYWDAGKAAMMLTDTANFRNPNYHCYEGVDEPATLSTRMSGRVLRATIATVAEALEPLP